MEATRFAINLLFLVCAAIAVLDEARLVSLCYRQTRDLPLEPQEPIATRLILRETNRSHTADPPPCFRVSRSPSATTAA